MKISTTKIPDVKIIEPAVFADSRGYFSETFNAQKFNEAIGYEVNFVQDNESKSTKGVLRGFHYQLPPYTQAKLVRMIEGSVLDVAVDIRKSSATFGQYVAVVLTKENRHQLFIPHGFAHGFVVLSDSATFAYKADNGKVYYFSALLEATGRKPLDVRSIIESFNIKNSPDVLVTSDAFDTAFFTTATGILTNSLEVP